MDDLGGVDPWSERARELDKRSLAGPVTTRAWADIGGPAEAPVQVLARER